MTHGYNTVFRGLGTCLAILLFVCVSKLATSGNGTAWKAGLSGGERCMQNVKLVEPKKRGYRMKMGQLASLH